mmetsp:Transcript_17472/g.52790  ORF Transcript_17472/g.52790 Transcript_17472/m.52790 type:complete len:174 (+) Transcript_17472:95-616(+)
MAHRMKPRGIKVIIGALVAGIVVLSGPLYKTEGSSGDFVNPGLRQGQRPALSTSRLRALPAEGRETGLLPNDFDVEVARLRLDRIIEFEAVEPVAEPEEVTFGDLCRLALLCTTFSSLAFVLYNSVSVLFWHHGTARDLLNNLYVILASRVCHESLRDSLPPRVKRTTRYGEF